MLSREANRQNSKGCYLNRDDVGIELPFCLVN